MFGLNRPAFAVVVSTIMVATAVALKTLATLGPVSLQQWWLFGLFTVLAGLSYFYPIELDGDERISYILSSAFLIAGSFTLPAGLLSLMCLLLVVPGFVRLRRRDRFVKDWFNGANYLLSTHAAALLIRWTMAHASFGPFTVVAVLGAIAVDMTLSTLLVGWVIALNIGVPLRQSPVWDFRFLAADAMVSTMGALAGLVTRVSPWAVCLAVLPLLLPYWLFRSIHMVRMVDVDPKTGLYNHRYFQKRLPDLLQHCHSKGRAVSILFADLDFLREVNNTHGHLAGDQVLKQVAMILREHTRPGDLLARWGGEEFVIVLPTASGATALGVADRLCTAIRNHPFEIGVGEPIHCTISIGVATATNGHCDVDALVHEADLAMYQAKAGGRDQARQAPAHA